MRIDAGTAAAMETAVVEHGGAVAGMPGLGVSLADLTLFSLDRGLFGSRGELMAEDRFITFRSDRGLRRLKDSKTIPYSAITSLEFDGAASWLRWTFRGAEAEFEIELENYTGRNGLGAGQILWYDIDSFPSRSLLFYRAAGTVLGGSGAVSAFNHPAPVSRTLEEAVTSFEQSPSLVSESLSQPNPFHLWTGVFTAFCSFLAGTTLSTGADADAWMEVFRSLDGFYARLLERFLREIDERSDAILSKESAINSLSDQFDRLTSLWYVRQIARLHFAEKHADPASIRPWSLSVLTPRALQAGGRLSIRLREKSMYEEEIRTLGS